MPKRRKKTITNYELGITNDNVMVTKSKAKKRKKIGVKISSKRKDQDNKDIILAENNAVIEPKLDNEPAEQKKKLIMWLGVSCMMAVFLVIWLFNLEYEFKASVKKNAGDEFDWSQTKSEFNEVIEQVKQSLAQLKQIQKNTPDVLPGKTELTVEQINLLKDKLLSEAGTSTASSTK